MCSSNDVVEMAMALLPWCTSPADPATEATSVDCFNTFTCTRLACLTAESVGHCDSDFFVRQL